MTNTTKIIGFLVFLAGCAVEGTGFPHSDKDAGVEVNMPHIGSDTKTLTSTDTFVQTATVTNTAIQTLPDAGVASDVYVASDTYVASGIMCKILIPQTPTLCHMWGQTL